MSHAVQVGSILEGKVIKIKPFGAIVSLGDGVQGLVHISQITKNFVQDINDVIVTGDMVKVKVLQVDEENNKITLSMKALEGENEKMASQTNDNQKRFSSFDNDHKTNTGEMSFDEKLKDWIKQSNERQAGINKRNNRR